MKHNELNKSRCQNSTDRTTNHIPDLEHIITLSPAFRNSFASAYPIPKMKDVKQLSLANLKELTDRAQVQENRQWKIYIKEKKMYITKLC